MVEEWATVRDFPRYNVSSCGRIENSATGRIMRLSTTSDGTLKVGLVSDATKTKQTTRSVKVLVAQAFVPGENDISNTVVLLDGDPENVHVDNLVWRPRWFAHQYARQFNEIGEWYTNRMVLDNETGEHYADIVEAAITNGILFSDILHSIVDPGVTCYPTKQTFRYA